MSGKADWVIGVSQGAEHDPLSHYATTASTAFVSQRLVPKPEPPLVRAIGSGCI